jgi:hypothetical protein
MNKFFDSNKWDAEDTDRSKDDAEALPISFIDAMFVVRVLDSDVSHSASTAIAK